MRTEDGVQELLRAQFFLEFFLDLAAVLMAVFVLKVFRIQPVRQRAEVPAYGHAHFGVFPFIKMNGVNIFCRTIRPDARLGGDFPESMPDFPQVERNVLDDMLDVCEMLLAL